MFSSFRRTDEDRLAALETKIEAAREECDASNDALAVASLDAAEGGDRAALERAEREHATNAIRMGQLELAMKRLRSDLEAKRAATAAAAQARRTADAKVSREALWAAVGAFQDKASALGDEAARVVAAIADYYRFADNEDRQTLADFRLAVPRVLEWFVRGITGRQPVFVITDSGTADLRRYLPRARS